MLDFIIKWGIFLPFTLTTSINSKLVRVFGLLMSILFWGPLAMVFCVFPICITVIWMAIEEA